MYHAKENGKLNYRFFRAEMALEDPEYQSAREELWRSLDWYDLTSTPSAHSSQ
jgi:hypothetical protein